MMKCIKLNLNSILVTLRHKGKLSLYRNTTCDWMESIQWA